MPTLSGPPRLRLLPGLAFFLVLCFLAAALGTLFMPGEWYTGLRKPAWNPPGWVFGPVWTLLYIMMAVAAALVWQCGGFVRRRLPLGLFLAQLLLNAIWTPLFFGLRSPALGFADICLLWLMLLATIAAFRRVRAAAAVLLLPYLAWVTFAAVLNLAIWRLNP